MVSILLMLILSGLCIYGAFLGTEAARQMFGSAPMLCFWVVAMVLSVAGSVASLFRDNTPLYIIYGSTAAIIYGYLLSLDSLIHWGYIVFIVAVVWKMWFCRDNSEADKCK